MDKYFYSVEMNDDGNKVVHVSGNVFFNDSDETETNYRYASWVFFYITPKELRDIIKNNLLFEYLCDNVKYEENITKDEAIDICKHYFNGKPGVFMPIQYVYQGTPCGDYWFEGAEIIKEF